MAALLPGMESMNFAPIIAKTMYWLGITILSMIMLGAMWFIWRMFTFKIAATIFPLYGSSQDGTFAIGKPKYNRIKWTKDRMAWVAMKPWLNNKEREPFDAEYIYPGNKVYIYELNDEWIPGRINVGLDEEQIRASISPVPIYIRNWQSHIHKKHAEEFAKLNFWNENKSLMTAMVVSIVCLVVVGVTVYFTYKFAGGGTAAMSKLTDAITNMNVIKGIAPG